MRSTSEIVQNQQGKGRKAIVLGRKMIPFLVFCLMTFLFSMLIVQAYQVNKERIYANAKLNAVSYGDRMIADFKQGIGVTETLEQIVVSENGETDRFSEIAENLMTDSLQSIQLAPAGIVTDIYPAQGNEAGKIDLLHDKDRKDISQYGIDHDMVIMQGPITLKQGGTGVAVRNPVFIENPRGEKTFWGFTIAMIRVPEVFSNSMNALHGFGYDYRLLKTDSPLSHEYKTIYGSREKMIDPATYEFSLGGCEWRLEVMPTKGWEKGNLPITLMILSPFIVLLTTGLTIAILVLEERRRTFRNLSVTDSLTGLLNRNGFDSAIRQYMKENPEEPCVGILLDIDNFKFVNDMYGHAFGDATLQEIARNIRTVFAEQGILARNGGDEFSILLKNCSGQEAKDRIEAFARMKHVLRYGTETLNFTVSLGYAEYPKQAQNQADLMTCADMALYDVKLHGKHGCLAYHEKLHIGRRDQLGFALHDVSENLPGAFLIYTAEQGKDHILFANNELIQFAGCRDMDDFMEFTDGHFRNLIHPDEQQNVEESIWQQITSQKDGTNDYVQFRFACKDGTYRPVLDHGRIVDSNFYGKVFYVLIMDCALIQSYYE